MIGCRSALYSFFLIWLAVIVHRILIYDISNHAWILGDWLINYQDGGFKRRGISGSFLFVLYNITGIKLQLLVFLEQLFFYVFFMFFFFKTLRYRVVTIGYVLFVLSPLTFVFCLNNLTSVGRKEIIIFSIFAFFVYSISSNSYSKLRENVVLTMIFGSVFFHEIMFFYVPYFIVVLYFFNQKVNWFNYSRYVMAAFIPVVFIYLFGGDINQGKTLAILLQKGVDIKGGIIQWPTEFDTFSYYLDYSKMYALYALSFLLGLVLVFFLLKELSLNNKVIKEFFMIIGACFIFTIPIFILAVDWGRWIYIHFTIILLICTLFLPQKSTSAENKNLIIKPFNVKVWFFLSFLLLWNMESYRMGFSFKGILYKVIIKMEEIYHFIF